MTLAERLDKVAPQQETKPKHQPLWLDTRRVRRVDFFPVKPKCERCGK